MASLYDSTSNSSSLQYDPELLRKYGLNYDRATQIANTPFTPYPNQRVADYTPGMRAGVDSIWNWATDPTAANTLDSAVTGAKDFSSYKAPTIGAPGTLNARSISSPTVTPQMLAGMDLSAYQNPFNQQVLDASLSDLSRARDIQRVSDNQSATRANAFGGSRQGVADSLTNDAYLRNVSSTSANLRKAGYDSAVAGATGDIARRYDADTFNATNRMNVDRYNASAGDAGDIFNINNRMAVDEKNAANDISSAGLRLRGTGLMADLADKQDSMGKDRAQAVYGLGKDEQANTQAKYDASYNEFMRQIGYPAQTQDLLNSTLNGFPRQTTGTNTSTQNPGIGSQIQSWAGLAGGAASLLNQVGAGDWFSGAADAIPTSDWSSYLDSLSINDTPNFDWNASWFDAPDFSFF